MSLSLFDLYKVGIGPSSSHTLGPMKAAYDFNQKLKSSGLIEQVKRLKCDLYGSLSLTGRGHKTDTAVILGLCGETPEGVDPGNVELIIQSTIETKQLKLDGQLLIPFDAEKDIKFNNDITLKAHPNGMTLSAFDNDGGCLLKETYFSVGGGFILTEEQAVNSECSVQVAPMPYPFRTGQDLLDQAEANHLTFTEIALANEQAITGLSVAEIRQKMLSIWQVMSESIERGCHTDKKVLDGGLGIRRRAGELYQKLDCASQHVSSDPLLALDWVNVFALAVNEENADGGRIVTAPTNGAAGVIPAVVAYYQRFYSECDDEKIFVLLTTAACIGMLYKNNASISAAEVGCQGEIGVACSMAAAGLTAVLGGNNQQIQNAAEIGMEHNLGLTCDPIDGLVQVPCIERNTMGAVKAINASRLALRGDGRQHVSLDKVISAMYQTGLDMQSKYKETSLGGLAVNRVGC